MIKRESIVYKGLSFTWESDIKLLNIKWTHICVSI